MSEIRKGLVLIGTIALMFTCACNPQEPLVESIDSTSAAVLGAVLTLSGEPVAQARVEIGEASTITGTDGRFELANLPQDQELDLFVRSSGHSTGHWPLRLADRQQLQLTLRVLEATEHQVDASSGGRIERDDGVVIDLPADSLFHERAHLVHGCRLFDPRPQFVPNRLPVDTSKIGIPVPFVDPLPDAVE